jgi:hypothetical protein
MTLLRVRVGSLVEAGEVVREGFCRGPPEPQKLSPWLCSDGTLEMRTVWRRVELQEPTAQQGGGGEEGLGRMTGEEGGE